MPDAKPAGRNSWTRDFKLKALSMMEATDNVRALAEQLGVRRELLYVWRQRYQAGGAAALHTIGRPPLADKRAEIRPRP
jgi:transposase-like protein